MHKAGHLHFHCSLDFNLLLLILNYPILSFRFYLIMIHLLCFISFYLKLLTNKAAIHSMTSFKVFIHFLILNLFKIIMIFVFIIQIIIIFHYQIYFFNSNYHLQLPLV